MCAGREVEEEGREGEREGWRRRDKEQEENDYERTGQRERHIYAKRREKDEDDREAESIARVGVNRARSKGSIERAEGGR